MTWALLIFAIVLEVTGTLCLRASDGLRHRRWIVPIALSYLAAFTLIALVLGRGMPVGIVYGIWVAGGVVLTAVLGRMLFQDPLTPKMNVGIALIATGVLLIELGTLEA
ncbi:DMT family transporter [Rhodococcus ruber]|uniref:Small multidrug resistance protein n=1 Tax=Rhodococcus ruber BKS 20-38 TaxID=1278076 RepID=M2XZL7_9NOCA|nr:multidrug efflux SMR transporter [Rhodococcus ruber]EME66331.1 small multidrug resistance protein [Rhodococcus ruber BKS 20-38]